MRIHIQIVLLIFIVLVATLSAVTWKAQELLISDKISFIADASMKQLAPLGRLVQETLGNQKDALVRFANKRVAKGAGSADAFEHFEVIGLLEVSANGRWAPTWVERAPEISGERWPTGRETVLLRSLPYGKVADGEVTWVRLSDPLGTPLYAVLLKVQLRKGRLESQGESQDGLPESADYGAHSRSATGVLVGFSGKNPLASVTDDFIGSINSVYIVDDRGYVASHTNRSFAGARLAEDPIVREIRREGKALGQMRFDDMKGQPLIGHYGRIDRTNLSAVITTPMTVVTALATAFQRIVWAAGLSIGLIGVALAWFISAHLIRLVTGAATIGDQQKIGSVKDAYRTLTTSSASMEDAKLGEFGSFQDPAPPSDPMSAGTSVVRPGPENEVLLTPENEVLLTPENEVLLTPENEVLRTERRKAFARFSQGFREEVHEPLLAILAHAQLAKTKTDDPELKSHAESIEREARHAKSVLESLQAFNEEREATEALLANGVSSDSLAIGTIDLRETVLSVLASLEAELIDDGIEVETDLASVPRIHAVASQMEMAVRHLIENAREAMFFRPEKRLSLRLSFDGNDVRLIVKDTGVGMSRESQAKAFEPFYKEFPSPKRMGLGLAFVRMALKSAGGTCDIESAPGEGSRFELKFAAPRTLKAAFVSKGLSDEDRVETKVTATLAEKFELGTEHVLIEDDSRGDSSRGNDSRGDNSRGNDERGDRVLRAEVPNDLSHELDDGDEQELFTSVTLAQPLPVFTAKTAQAPAAVSAPPPERPGGFHGDFKMRIRRPRTSVLPRPAPEPAPKSEPEAGPEAGKEG